MLEWTAKQQAKTKQSQIVQHLLHSFNNALAEEANDIDDNDLNSNKENKDII